MLLQRAGRTARGRRAFVGCRRHAHAPHRPPHDVTVTAGDVRRGPRRRDEPGDRRCRRRRAPALGATAVDALGADGFLLGTPANLGYISGALKHFFDQIYYPCLEATIGRPFALYVHGNSDTTGAVRAVETITTGLQWKLAQPPLEIVGDPGKDDLDQCWELGAALAATLTM